ncbi:MAG: DUF433 domain-containing protein [bacterium]|nr:DUF433 domain-containing protein [bacterium]
MKNLIISKKSILGGTPVVRGTRIPVSSIMGQMSAANGGDKNKYIKKVYPNLTQTEIDAAIRYAGELASRT